jgi:Zn-dependent protease with chaperone function
MMAQVINYVIEQIPGGTIVAAPLQYALFYWSRMSEFTADRAGLLCCQNMKAVARAFIKMSGLPINHYSGIDERSFIEQAKDFEQLEYENMNKIIKFLLTLGQDHPWTVMRTGQLIDWVNSGEVKKIMLNH